MPAKLFLDTAYAIALSSPRDEYHTKAMELSLKMIETDTKMITTRAVLLEIGNSLSSLRYRSKAVDLLKLLEFDPDVEIISVSNQLYMQAFDLYQNRQDKEWGLVDCMSFVVMWDRDISAALTSDLHFRQAGFDVLLRS